MNKVIEARLRKVEEKSAWETGRPSMTASSFSIATSKRSPGPSSGLPR